MGAIVLTCAKKEHKGTQQTKVAAGHHATQKVVPINRQTLQDWLLCENEEDSHAGCGVVRTDSAMPRGWRCGAVLINLSKFKYLPRTGLVDWNADVFSRVVSPSLNCCSVF